MGRKGVFGAVDLGQVGKDVDCDGEVCLDVGVDAFAFKRSGDFSVRDVSAG